MPSPLQDLRFALRMLRKNAGFTLATVLILALGIGANTAVFTVTSALLLRPFGYRESQNLVTIQSKDKTTDRGITLLRYELLRDHARSFDSVAVWTNDNMNFTGHGEPLQLPVARVSANFFSLLGVEPQLGRPFNEDESRPEGKPVVMLGDSFWRTHFGGDKGILGQTVNLDGTPYTVIGVLPSGIQFPFVGKADLWIPRYFEFTLMTPQQLRSGVGYLQIVARRHSDVGMDRVQAELGVLNGRYREENPKAPDADPDVLMTATPLRETIISDERGKIVIRSIAVAVVLLIACANVAGLLLSRGLSRRREIAVRIALGARRSLIVRQLLTESVLQAFMAGILGVGLGWAATLDLVWWGGSRPTQGIPIVMDVRVLLFTITLSLLTGIAFGIFPALQLSRADLNSTLREEARGASVGHARMRLTSLLVVGQVALSLLLLIVAGLLLRSFSRLLRVDPGFDGGNVLVMNVSLPTAKYAKGGDQIAFFDELLRRVSSVPGAQNAAVSAALPLTIKRITPVLPEGLQDRPLAQRPFIDIEAVSPLWFRTMRVPVRMGREFTAADNADAPKAVIVNESFARRFWPNQKPIGKHVTVGRWPQPTEVVGVVGDVKNRGLALDPAPQLYLPFPQLPWGNMNLLVRTGVAPLSLAQAVRAQIASLDPDQPVTDIQTVDDLLDESRAESRSASLSLGMLAATALLLAMIGIYSMLAYSVEQRRQEIGVRIALGADRPDIMRLIVGRGLILSAIGIAIGLAAALPATRLISGMLYKVSALDPVTFVLGPPIFFFTALLAGFLPARRATKVAPTEALRES